MKLSARNVLKGKVVDIDKGQVTAIVRVDIGGGNIITSSITMAALKDLKLKKGSTCTPSSRRARCCSAPTTIRLARRHYLARDRRARSRT